MTRLGERGMEQYQKILVGVDGSSQSKLALTRAIDLAQACGAAILIATVQNDGKFANLAAGRASVYRLTPEVVDESRQQIQLFVNQCLDQARAAGVSATAQIFYGNSKEELAVALPRREQVDLIVVGATGLNRMERMIIGSTAGYIVSHAAVDVVVVKDDD